MTSTSHMKKTTIPGMLYPATLLVLATAPQLPGDTRLIRDVIDKPARSRFNRLIGQLASAATQHPGRWRVL